MPGPVEEAAREQIAAAEERIRASKVAYDHQMFQAHFVVDASGKEVLRNNSSEHGDSLTAEEMDAVKILREGKKIPKTKLDTFEDENGDEYEGLAGGGSLVTAEWVAAKCDELNY